MNWDQAYPRDQQPDFDQISQYVNTPVWEQLNQSVQSQYKVQPLIQHSVCSGAPGWNVKYRKNGRSLCVLYPDRQIYTCLVCIGTREAPEAELQLSRCSSYTQDVYWKAKPLNGARWLMLSITSQEIMQDALRLIATRLSRK